MNMDQWNKLFLVLCFLWCLPGCRRWRTHHRKPGNTQTTHEITPVLNKQHMNKYELAIKGIECKQCILSILQDLHDSTLVDYVECLCKKDDYAHAKIICYLDQQKKLDLKKIKEVVEQENFILSSITGTFDGAVVQKEDKLLFQLPEFPEPFLLMSKNDMAELKPTQGAALTGTLLVDKKKLVLNA